VEKERLIRNLRVVSDGARSAIVAQLVGGGYEHVVLPAVLTPQQLDYHLAVLLGDRNFDGPWRGQELKRLMAPERALQFPGWPANEGR